MTAERALAETEAEDLFEDAPCAYISTALDGTIRRVNRTFERTLGFDRRDVVGSRRFVDLLSPAGRIYHETHFAPLLRMQGSISQVAMDLVRADGSRMSALVNSVLVEDGASGEIRTMIFDATDRRLYEEQLLEGRREEHEIAVRLQESLLSGDLPSGSGVEVSVAYRPAVRGLEVGGDWYDAFWLAESRVALVVGDVVGRGIEAAATMGQLRSATRALAMTESGPAGVLTALDDYASRHGIGTMATVVYAEVDLDAQELRYACAGHPPPLLVEGAEIHVLREGRSVPLAVRLRKPRTRPEARRRLSAAAMLLLYTDGVVERRDRSIDEGERRLLDAVRAHHGEPAGVLADEIVRQLPDRDSAPDDVCMLAASLDVPSWG